MCFSQTITTHKYPTILKRFDIHIKVLTISKELASIGSDNRPPILFRGDFPQCRVRFLDFVDRQTDGALILDSIFNGPKEFYIDPVENVYNNPPLQNARTLKPYLSMTQDENDRVRADQWENITFFKEFRKKSTIV